MIVTNHQLPGAGGSIFLFNRHHVPFFRRDSHTWRKKAGNKSVREAHEKLKARVVASMLHYTTRWSRLRASLHLTCLYFNCGCLVRNFVSCAPDKGLELPSAANATPLIGMYLQWTWHRQNVARNTHTSHKEPKHVSVSALSCASVVVWGHVVAGLPCTLWPFLLLRTSGFMSPGPGKPLLLPGECHRRR